jgi:hypothetical protein
MTGFRRVATCKCCGVDKCGGKGPTTGCTSTISSCPSTYAVTFGVSSHTVKVNCGTLGSPDCQDYIEYPATTFPAVTVTQNATNKCEFEGAWVDVSGVSDSWNNNPCSGDPSYTYNWDELLINVTNDCAHLLDSGYLCPCWYDADDSDHCTPQICAGVCAEVYLKYSISTGRSTTYGTRNFSACFFSHCIGSCTDLVPCYNSYGSPNTTRHLIHCPDTSPMDICSPCISDGSNGWKVSCSTPNYRGDAEWACTASIS